MLEVGEESGQITDMLDKVADYYDKEVETATDSLTSAMEPLLVVLMGVVIGAHGHLPLPADVLDLPAHPASPDRLAAGVPDWGAGASRPARHPGRYRIVTEYP